jgi:hypothetical protein
MHFAGRKKFIQQLLNPKTNQAFQKALFDYQSLCIYSLYIVISHDDDVLQNTFIKIFQKKF